MDGRKERVVEKAEKKIDKLDLSKDEDLSIGVMNLVSLEEHLYFSSMKTSDKSYLKILEEIREIRTEMMEELVGETKAEEWCISKHLLASSMRLIETGNKLKEKNNEKYLDMYERGFELYSLFWHFKLGDGNVDKKEEKIEQKSKEKHSGKNIAVKEGKIISSSEKSLKKKEEEDEGVLQKAKNLVRKAVDCCIET